MDYALISSMGQLSAILVLDTRMLPVMRGIFRAYYHFEFVLHMNFDMEVDDGTWTNEESAAHKRNVPAIGSNREI